MVRISLRRAVGPAGDAFASGNIIAADRSRGVGRGHRHLTRFAAAARGYSHQPRRLPSNGLVHDSLGRNRAPLWRYGKHTNRFEHCPGHRLSGCRRDSARGGRFGGNDHGCDHLRGSRNRDRRRRRPLLGGCLCDRPRDFRPGGHRLVRRSPQLEAASYGVPHYHKPCGKRSNRSATTAGWDEGHSAALSQLDGGHKLHCRIRSRRKPQPTGEDCRPAQSETYHYRSDSARGPSRMTGNNGAPRKPKALAAGARLGVFAPASPAESVEMIAGLAELKRQGFQVVASQDTKAEGYFAGPPLERANGFLGPLNSDQVDGLVALRGGYGSNYLLELHLEKNLATLKSLIEFTALTTLQIFLWQKCNWITFYGQMVAAGLTAGPGARKAYDESSFLQAVGKTEGGWKLRLKGEAVLAGQSMGRVLGGCMTLLEATVGTPWELDTKDSILVLEDRAMKPYQVDRVLMHLKQAGKFEGVRRIAVAH